MITPTLADTWTVTDVLKPHGLSRLSGDPGAGKSLVAFDLALSVASGVDWAGRKVTQGRVLFVTSDLLTTIRPRLMAWKKFNRVAEIPNLLIYPVSLAVEGESWSSFTSACLRVNPDVIVFDGPFWELMAEAPNLTIIAPQDVRGLEQTNELAITLAGLRTLADRTNAAVLVTHNSTDAPDADLVVTGDGTQVTVRVRGREGAAPFRFKVAGVSLPDQDPSVVLALVGPSRTVLTVPGLH